MASPVLNDLDLTLGLLQFDDALPAGEDMVSGSLIKLIGDNPVSRVWQDQQRQACDRLQSFGRLPSESDNRRGLFLVDDLLDVVGIRWQNGIRRRAADGRGVVEVQKIVRKAIPQLSEALA